ncbi:putative galactose oxidase precursor [Hyaloraphidium curvatum]|nr:putative galactose oxidase precursor [Hyaloraphidium curvatum]
MAAHRGPPWAAAAMLAIFLVFPGRTAGQAASAGAGSWGPVFTLPLVPAASAALPGEPPRVLVWAAYNNLKFGGGGAVTQTAVVDVAALSAVQYTVTNTRHDAFCPGTSVLADGRLLVTGGNSPTQTSAYDPTAGSWTPQAPMVVPRGYNGQTTLADGTAFVLGGSWSGDRAPDRIGELFNPAGGGWKPLPGVSARPIWTNDSQGKFLADNHGWFVALPGGKVFHAGPSKNMNWITTSGQGTISPAGRRGDADDQMCGGAVVFDAERRLLVAFGGARDYNSGNFNATGATYVIDYSSEGAADAAVARSGDMLHPRSFHTAVLLPDGTVMAVGGMRLPVPFTDATAVMVPELWDPATGNWTELAPMNVPRCYHSSAVLMPDGRVFAGGGGLCQVDCPAGVNHPDAQIYAPGYLLEDDGTLRPRVAILSAPDTLENGTAEVLTDAPAASFSLIRYGVSTHSVNNDQRRIVPTILSSSNTSSNAKLYTIAFPSDPGILLPGPWMLFALDPRGTPSLARTVLAPGELPPPWPRTSTRTRTSSTSRTRTTSLSRTRSTSTASETSTTIMPSTSVSGESPVPSWDPSAEVLRPAAHGVPLVLIVAAVDRAPR